MVTHSSTSRPVQCLCMAERTGCPVLTDLWSYVLKMIFVTIYTYVSLSAAYYRLLVERTNMSAYEVQLDVSYGHSNQAAR
jgi:hypothetical protein